MLFHVATGIRVVRIACAHSQGALSIRVALTIWGWRMMSGFRQVGRIEMVDWSRKQRYIIYRGASYTRIFECPTHLCFSSAVTCADRWVRCQAGRRPCRWLPRQRRRNLAALASGLRHSRNQSATEWRSRIGLIAFGFCNFNVYCYYILFRK